MYEIAIKEVSGLDRINAEGRTTMNERIQKLISLLLKKPDITITEVMQKLSLTRRQVNYALSIVNDQLKAEKLVPIKRHHNGKFEITEDTADYLQMDRGLGLTEYRDEERQALILFYLICNLDYVSLRHLTHFVGYSRTTIVSDIRNISRLLKKWRLELKYNRQTGYHLTGTEEDILRLATYLIINYKDLLVTKSSDNFFKHNIRNLATTVILEIENKFRATFSDRYFETLRELIEIILLRSTNDNFQEQLDSLILSTREYQFLRNYTLLKDLDNQHIKWITLEILSSNVYDKDNSDFGEDENKILDFVHQIVEGFKAKTIVDIEGNKAKDMACPADPKWRQYLVERYAQYASIHPKRLWLEDDFRHYNHSPLKLMCFCPRHMKIYQEKLGKK